MRSRSSVLSIRRVVPLLGALVVTIAGWAPAAAQSSGGWSQLQGDAAHSGQAAAAAAPPYREVWRFDPGLTGRFGVSPAVIAGSLAVTVGPRAVYAVDLTTGDLAWELPRAYGPSSAPAISTGDAGDVLVYTEGYGPNPPQEAFASATPSASAEPTASATPSPDGEAAEDGTQTDSRVVAVDVETREPVWDASVDLPAVSRTGVTVDDGVAYVGDDDGTVTAIDVATGDVAWTFDAPGPVVSSLAAADGTVVFSAQPTDDEQGAIIALDAADGSESWRFAQSGPVLASIPAIAGDTVYLAVATLASNSVRALALADGSERWNRPVSAQVSPVTVPVVAGEVVYMVDFSGQAHALSTATGEETWDFAINTVVFRAGPVLAGTSLLVPTNRGSLLAIDTTSHDLVATATAAGPQGHLGALTVTPDVVVAVKGGHAPGLVAFEHDPDAALTAEPSPTVLRPGAMLGSFALAALPMLVLLALAGRWLNGRLGPAFAETGDEGDDDDTEPIP